jgi:ribosome maturation factor RimP
MSKITEKVWSLAQPVADELNLEIWEVEFVKEAGTQFLRVYLDKEEGVSINDCEAVSRPLSDKLDEVDPIEGSYTFEVSSAGAERALKKPEHFEKMMGQQVEIRLYRAADGKKSLVGTLSGYEGGDVTVTLADGPRTFPKADVAQVRLYVTF